MKEVKQIIDGYLQNYKDIEMLDVVIVKEIEKTLEELFLYCDKQDLQIQVIKGFGYEYELRFIVSKEKSRLIDIDGGDANIYLPYNAICELGTEKNFLKELRQFILRIKGLDGIDTYIREITKGPENLGFDVVDEEFF